MLFSVFTPTNKADWIKDCYYSLLAQENQDWEWVVVANGPEEKKVFAEVYKTTLGDSRVKIFAYPSDRPQGIIGSLKKFAVSKCRGDILVELDHDDQLTSDCLHEVEKALGREANAFVYSDCAFVNANGINEAFGTYYGWKSPYVQDDKYINQMFPVTPASLAYIGYCPDHVRCWTRKAMELSGGYSDLAICDDQDLMVRTYLAGSKMIKIPKSLYNHRVQKSSASALLGNEIGEQSMKIRDNNFYALVEEWCRREDLLKIDLGGLHNCPKGWIPVDQDECVCDIEDGVCADVVDDNFPEYLYSVLRVLGHKNKVGCIRAHDFLEHIPSHLVPSVLRNLYEVLAPGGYLLTKTPAVCDDKGRCGRGAFQDPTHKSFWSSNNWWYYTKKSFSKYVPEIDFSFVPVRLFNAYPSAWHEQHLIPYVYADMVKDYPEGHEVWVPGIRE